MWFVWLYPSVYPKSKIKFDSLKACLYSPKNKGCSDAYILVVKVKSLSLFTLKKYGSAKPDPKFLESVKIGGKKPDLRLTVGSGWENLGA